MENKVAELREQLNSFDREKRADALSVLSYMLKNNEIKAAGSVGAVNMHFHTFFSFNGEGYSPSRVAWEAKMAGLDAAGSVDFDVLDAMDEFYAAGDLLELRTAASLESRVFMSQLADKSINSPGEPGVSYFMGVGFTKLPAAGSKAGEVLSDMRRTAGERNIAMLGRIEAHIAPLAIDYEKDVLPLTPSGNATERHMLAALDDKAREMFTGDDELVSFWAAKLGIDYEQIEKQVEDQAALRNSIRARLMKRGGVGYVQPTADSFPAIEKVVEMVLGCEAIPCGAWLDGSSDGEEDAEKLMDIYSGLGCLAFNIIPDRNYNFADAEKKAEKVKCLEAIMRAARKRDMIIIVGTEMNSYGQKFVDDFAAPELAPYIDDFRKGAVTLCGHVLMQRALGMGRTSEWAKGEFGEDRAAANAFYFEVGEKAASPKRAIKVLSALDAGCSREQVFDALTKI